MPQREHRDRNGCGQHSDQRRSRVHAPPLARELDVEGLQLCEVVVQTVDHELVEVLRLLDVLEPPLAQVSDRDFGRQVLLRQPLGRPGEQHLAAVACGADPRCSMDADTHVALGTHLGLARVQAHPHLDLRSLRPRMGRQVALGVDRCSHGVVGGCEADEEGVALGVDDHPTMGSEGGEQHLLMGG